MRQDALVAAPARSVCHLPATLSEPLSASTAHRPPLWTRVSLVVDRLTMRRGAQAPSKRTADGT
jgi:hypothetical protein